ncbi:flagellin N-terminal helical domain-containing protein [Mobilicoccus pelagius]|uniref:Flagellin n=1 Tax=Mobilicoccus pelagius NBRC 104925 TaxID=1089455 RepID=H5UQW0_9MICO|nr:flagellin [Mobilicoccus pelagius]GAB48118.1 flagellin [Mobilicoccus pelagius NBRC 104925]
MRINQNVAAMNAYRHTSANQGGVGSAMERLSSGLRINRAADDAARLAISEGMRAQANGLGQAVENIGAGIDLLQTAEGDLHETHAVLQRMRTLAVQAANGTNSAENRQQIQAEMNQLMAQIDTIADSTQYNGMPLLDGTFVKKDLQVGANAGDTKTITIGSPLVGATPAQAPAFALWNLDKADERAKLPNPFVVEQALTTTGEKIRVSVPLDPMPTDASELAARLSADPTFSAAFEATTGPIVEADGTRRPAANLIITAKEKGAGEVRVPNTGGLLTKTRGGRDEVQEGGYSGYHAVELLGGPIDVTTEAGSEVVTWPPRPGGIAPDGEGFGSADYVPRVVPPSPGGSDVVTRSSGAADAIARIDRAIERVSRGRAEMGATQNALQHAARSNGLAAENLALSESRIRDADIAKEVTSLQRHQVLCQASLSMLAQANKVPESILSLLK